MSEGVGEALAMVLAEQSMEDEARTEQAELAKIVAARAADPFGVEQLDEGQRVEEVDVVVGHDGLQGRGARAHVGRFARDACKYRAQRTQTKIRPEVRAATRPAEA